MKITEAAVLLKPMKGFSDNIEQEAVWNSNFRKVLYTSSHLQVVLMSLKAGEDIGEEIHNASDQFFRFEAGNGHCIINGNVYVVKKGDAIVVPAGAKHNVMNTDAQTDLKMYTIYAPPHHQDGIVRATKNEALLVPEKFEGAITE